MKIIIFSGTTEGRSLSEMLSEYSIEHFVSVATEYGNEVMSTKPDNVHVGKMDCDEMTDYLRSNGFGEQDALVDATHPYAEKARENIIAAAKRIGCGYYRVERARGAAKDPADAGDGAKSMRRYADMADFAGYINGMEGNILLTTGTNDLESYCENVSDETLSRTYARVLPATESLEKCRAFGIKGSHVYAMQGPFSVGMNKAMLKELDIRHMLTKESGPEGGYNEKIKAAKELGVACHVIARPAVSPDCGSDIYTVFEKLTGRAYAPKRKIILAGIGPGSPGCMTADVADAIKASDAIFGASSVTADIDHPVKYDMYLAKDVIAILSKDPGIRTAVIAFSGDPGLYSGAGKAYEEICRWDEDADVSILPGISSVTYLGAKLGISREDAKIVSIHGVPEEAGIRRLVADIGENRKTFALLSSGADIPKIARSLISSGTGAAIWIGSNLSSKDESIMKLSPDEALRTDPEGKITALFINDTPVKKPVINMKRDGEFIREKIPMTKECVRHESIIRLDIRKCDTVLDIGGGTGAVAIEAASLDPSISVITIEKDKDAARLIQENIDRSGLHNIELIEGDAADVIPKLVRPDCVFIGGSGGKLVKIISLLSKKGRGIRYVINAVSLETIGEVTDIINREGATDLRITQIAVSDIKAVGEHHMMHANNPVTVFSFTL